MAAFSVCMGVTYSFLLFLLLRRQNRQIIFSAYNLIILFFILVYGALFPLSHVLTSNGYNIQDFTVYFDSLGLWEISVYYIMVCAVTLPVLFVLKQSKNRRILNELFVVMNENDGLDDSKMMKIAILMLIVGIISDYLYLRVYGSYANYLRYSASIRSGVITINNPFSFLIPFRGCVAFASYLFFALCKEGKYKIIGKVLFVVSFIYAIRIMYSNAGRMALIIYFLILLIFLLINKFKPHNIGTKVVFGSLVLLIVFSGLLIFIGSILERTETTSVVTTINREISFIYVNFFACFEKLSTDFYRFFADAINFPIYLLPSSIWMSKLHILTASDYMTIFTSGGVKGSAGVYGEMPIDLITISYMQIGALGIVILPIVYSILFCKVCKYIKKINAPTVQLMLGIYVFFMVGVETIFYADPKHIVNRCFPLIIFVLIYYVVKRIRILK